MTAVIATLWMIRRKSCLCHLKCLYTHLMMCENAIPSRVTKMVSVMSERVSFSPKKNLPARFTIENRDQPKN